MGVSFVVIVKNRTRCFLKIAFYASSCHVGFVALAAFVAWADMIDSGSVFVQTTVTIGTFPTPRFKNVLPKTFAGKFWA